MASARRDSAIVIATASIVLFAIASPASGHALEGQIVDDESNTALASVEIRIHRIGTTALLADLESDSDGKFQLLEAPSGEYLIEFSKPNYASESLHIRVTDSPVSPGSITVHLVRCGMISGAVTGPQNQPVPDAYVYAIAKHGEGDPGSGILATATGSYARTDDHGAYRLYGLQPGQYYIAVSYGASTMEVGSTGSAVVRPGIGSGAVFYPSNTAPQPLTISGGEELANIDFAVQPVALFRVSGKLDIPQPGGIFWLALAAAHQSLLATAVAQSATDGSFGFDGIAPGSYTLFASGPSNARSGSGGILGEKRWFGRAGVNVSGQDVDGISMPLEKGRRAIFRLRAGSQGACPETAIIRLSSLEDWAALLDSSTQLTMNREQVVDGLAPARYRVSVSTLDDRCYSQTEMVLDLSGSASPASVTITVAPSGSIQGHLASSDQLRNFAIVLLAIEPVGNEPPVRLAYPDEKSNFSFAGLRPGKYRIGIGLATNARWVQDVDRMTEVDVSAGEASEVDLHAPASPNVGK